VNSVDLSHYNYVLNMAEALNRNKDSKHVSSVTDSQIAQAQTRWDTTKTGSSA